MSSMIRKFQRNKQMNVQMSIKFQCPNCEYEKLIPKETIQNLNPKTFKDNEIFKCPKCNIRMNPITIEVDY